MIVMPSPELFFDTRYVTPHLKLLPANSLSFDQLYTHYLEAGFIYPAKLEKLLPHFDLIRENWTRAYAAGRGLLWTIAYEDERYNKMGTVTAWRATINGWQSQHLTSRNHAAGLLYLLLAAQDEGILTGCASGQNWYSPTNAFAMKIYGRMTRVLGEDCADAQLLNYFLVDPSGLRSESREFKVVRGRQEDQDMVRQTCERLRGRVYCEAEEIDGSDIELDALDRAFRRYGLRRRRFIWMALDKGSDLPVGMVMAYRGPFGLNFSFLENRCDLMVAPDLDPGRNEAVCRILMAKAAQAYFDSSSLPEYPLSRLVVMAPENCEQAVADLGGIKARQYNQGIWLNRGFEKWKKYMMRVFSPVIQRFEKQNRMSETTHA